MAEELVRWMSGDAEGSPQLARAVRAAMRGDPKSRRGAGPALEDARRVGLRILRRALDAEIVGRAEMDAWKAETLRAHQEDIKVAVGTFYGLLKGCDPTVVPRETYDAALRNADSARAERDSAHAALATAEAVASSRLAPRERTIPSNRRRARRAPPDTRRLRQ